jgi:hypothetical protein
MLKIMRGESFACMTQLVWVTVRHERHTVFTHIGNSLAEGGWMVVNNSRKGVVAARCT